MGCEEDMQSDQYRAQLLADGKPSINMVLPAFSVLSLVSRLSFWSHHSRSPMFCEARPHSSFWKAEASWTEKLTSSFLGSLSNPEVFRYGIEAYEAYKKTALTSDILEEQKKVQEADLVIFQVCCFLILMSRFILWTNSWTLHLELVGLFFFFFFAHVHDYLKYLSYLQL